MVADSKQVLQRPKERYRQTTQGGRIWRARSNRADKMMLLQDRMQDKKALASAKAFFVCK
ncbi:MAG: hypothetical protein FWD76_05235 [Firmicutes bacterium]|nr:hypothetical protein [Bacillota bacterium]